MDNFDLKKYLAEGRLFKEEISTYQYPEEILALDKEIADLKTKLQSLTRARGKSPSEYEEIADLKDRLQSLTKEKIKAKSDYTKSMPSIFGQGEYAGMKYPKDKRRQYQFKSIVDFVKKVSKESGNDWGTLVKSLETKFPNSLLDTHTTGSNDVVYLPNIFHIDKGENEFTKADPSNYIKIGNWYIRPW